MFEWCPVLVLTLQDSVLAHSWREGAGRLRETVVRVVDGTGATVFQPPAADDVPALVRELTTWANEAVEVPAPVVSAMVHLGVAAIHPFRDGNGRTSRVCAALAMYRGGFLAPEFTSRKEWWGTHMTDYYWTFDVQGRTGDRRTDVAPDLKAHVGQARGHE